MNELRFGVTLTATSLLCLVGLILSFTHGHNRSAFLLLPIGIVLLAPFLGLVFIVIGMRRQQGTRRTRILSLVFNLGIMGFYALATMFVFAAVSMGSPGRPFRRGRRKILAEFAPGTGWAPAPSEALVVPEDRRAAVLAFFRHAAQEEHAAVAAFAESAKTLLAEGAPASLVSDTFVAAQDEVRHATIAVGLLRDLEGTEIVPAPCPDFAGSSRAFPPFGARNLRHEIAEASWYDGCISEGLSALLFDFLAEASAPWAPRATFAAIAKDERRHADLAWEVLNWSDDGSEKLEIPETLGSLPKSFLEAQAFFDFPLAESLVLRAKLRAFRESCERLLERRSPSAVFVSAV